MPAAKPTNAHALRFLGNDSDWGVFFRWPRPDPKQDVYRIEPRDAYHPFACPRCRRIDRERALNTAGVDPDLARHTRRIKADAFTTRDLQDVVSQRLFDFLAGHFPTALVGHPIPGTDQLVVLPKRPITIFAETPKSPADSAYRTTGKPCPACGHYRETTLRPDRVRLPASAHLKGLVSTAHRYGETTSWLCDDAARDALSSRRWTGLKVQEQFFGPDSPVFERAARVKAAQTAEYNARLKLLRDNGMDGNGRRLKKGRR